MHQQIRILRRCAIVSARFTIFIAVSASMVVTQTLANTTEPVEKFFRLPQFRAAALNPSATQLAYIREVNGRYGLLSMDTATRKLMPVADSTSADVVEFRWISDKRLMYRVENLRVGVGDNEVHGWYAIDVDGNKVYTLSEGLVSASGTVGANRGLPARAEFLSRVKTGDPDDFIAVQFAESPVRSTLLRINSRTGARRTLDPGGLENVIDWALDANDVARAAVSRDKNALTVSVRDSETAPWRSVGKFSQFENAGFTPIRFDKAGTLFVSARLGSDTSSIHRFDWVKGTPEREPLVSVKDYDIDSGLIFDEDGKLLGVRYEADQEGTFWIDPVWKAHQEAIDAALPGRVNLISGVADGTVLVRTYSDTSPPRFFLYETKVKKLSLLGSSRPWIDEKTQARSDVVRYIARDGLTVPALLTLPRGIEPKNLPLVLLAHGGPNVRGIHWGWSRETQFLASRGYAVLEPDFRGSLNHGWKLFRAGWRQWGLSMQDDLADAVLDLTKRGLVDKNRVCIAGASYGGYATVMGLI